MLLEDISSTQGLGFCLSELALLRPQPGPLHGTHRLQYPSRLQSVIRYPSLLNPFHGGVPLACDIYVRRPDGDKNQYL